MSAHCFFSLAMHVFPYSRVVSCFSHVLLIFLSSLSVLFTLVIFFLHFFLSLFPHSPVCISSVPIFFIKFSNYPHIAFLLVLYHRLPPFFLHFFLHPFPLSLLRPISSISVLCFPSRSLYKFALSLHSSLLFSSCFPAYLSFAFPCPLYAWSLLGRAGRSSEHRAAGGPERCGGGLVPCSAGLRVSGA